MIERVLFALAIAVFAFGLGAVGATLFLLRRMYTVKFWVTFVRDINSPVRDSIRSALAVHDANERARIYRDAQDL